MRFGAYEVDVVNQVHIMGILNVTPDSFSDGGRYQRIDDALRQAERMVSEGAAIIDVGGESTRPGYTKISDEEEIERVVPVIEKLRQRFDVPVSVDTYKAAVAEAAVAAGAGMINDIWGGGYDSGEMCRVMAKYPDTAVCLMHNRREAVYENYPEDIAADMCGCVDRTLAAGVSKDRIVLDPGIGFAKSCQENLILMNHLNIITEMGFPVLLGTSRKSMIGLTLELPVEERLEGTIATTVFGIMKGCRIIRVHDVKENYRAAKMTMAMLQADLK